MTTQFDVITFDCYGTLVDWESGISDAMQRAAADHGQRFSREAVVEAYHHIEPEIQSQTYRPYRDVLAAAASATAAQLKWDLDVREAGFLAESLAGWKPFPETNAALERLVADGYSLGILSNIDDDLLEGTLSQLSVRFDLLITAEQVRSYKPGHAHFEQARSEIGSRRWIHAAQSYFHDVVPASELGIPVVWVNRKHEEPTATIRPDGEVGTLTELAAWLHAG